MDRRRSPPNGLDAVRRAVTTIKISCSDDMVENRYLSWLALPFENVGQAVMITR